MNHTRRNFIKTAAASAALSALPDLGCNPTRKKKKKLILSFYLDDTNPGEAGPEAYKTFLDYCSEHGIKGESSLILGYNGVSLPSDPDPDEMAYLEYAKTAYDKGIDAHMEIMTHAELYDFQSGKIHEDGIHEGLWLHEPGITMEEYYRYFAAIITDGTNAGLKFTGLTWPGCGCDACTLRYSELREKGPLEFNSKVFDALLQLTREKGFRQRVIPIFYNADENNYGIYQKAADGKYGVYDLMPNAMDHFGIWENSKSHVDPDYYITEDGKSGIIIKHLKEEAPYCIWYMHWQGLNPAQGVGWEAFKTVTDRIETHLNDRVAWMRPGDIVTRYHDAGGWGFTEDL